MPLPDWDGQASDASALSLDDPKGLVCNIALQAGCQPGTDPYLPAGTDLLLDRRVDDLPVSIAMHRDPRHFVPIPTDVIADDRVFYMQHA
mgnify:CR=1 FL=1